MIPRALESAIEQWSFRGKVIILYGPGQSGKTTAVLKKHGDCKAYYRCKVPSVRAARSDRDPGLLKRVFGHKKLVVLDEARHLPEIGLVLKLLVDTFRDLQILWKHTKRKVPPALENGYPQSEARFIDRSNHRYFLDHRGPGY